MPSTQEHPKEPHSGGTGGQECFGEGQRGSERMSRAVRMGWLGWEQQDVNSPLQHRTILERIQADQIRLQYVPFLPWGGWIIAAG